MTEQQIKRIRKWWHAYVRRFDAGDADLRRNMRLKEAHTLRVCKEAASIARALAISPEDLRLTEALVLLHDVGRFCFNMRGTGHLPTGSRKITHCSLEDP